MFAENFERYAEGVGDDVRPAGLIEQERRAWRRAREPRRARRGS